MKILKISLLLTVLTLTVNLNVESENWPNWRGLNSNGSTTDQGLPDKFSKTEYLRWQVDLPGDGASAPIVWENGIYLTSIDESVGEVVAMKLDRQTEKII